MKQFLNDYIERMRPPFTGIPEKTAHEIASAFLTFKFGVFANAINECAISLSLLPANDNRDSAAALRKALLIVKASAEDLLNAQVAADISVSFSEREIPFVAVNLPPELIEDPGTLTLDNAQVLLYAVATLTSPDDEQALDEHRSYILKLLSAYKRALGIR